MTDLRESCRGKWKSILPMVGVDTRFLSGRHGPCPMCGGKDRFRFDDREGRGTYFCSQCAPGDGIDLVMRLKGWDFKEAKSELERLSGSARIEAPKAKAGDDYIRKLQRRIWNEATPVRYGDLVSRYLDSRGISLDEYPAALRFSDKCLYRSAGMPDAYHPAMIAVVRAHDDSKATLHRTYLTDAGTKLPVDEPRKLLSALPEGASVRLGAPAEVMGVAEGIETALAASIIWNMPVWAAINKANLRLWRPPVEAKEIYVFADNDRSFGGQANAYLLAERLAQKMTVHFEMPQDAGMDWNDCLMADRAPQAA